MEIISLLNIRLTIKINDEAYQITILCMFSGLVASSLQPIKSLHLCACTCPHQINPSSSDSQVPPPLKFGPMGPLVDPTVDYKYECLYHFIVSIIST